MRCLQIPTRQIQLVEQTNSQIHNSSNGRGVGSVRSGYVALAITALLVKMRGKPGPQG